MIESTSRQVDLKPMSTLEQKALMEMETGEKATLLFNEDTSEANRTSMTFEAEIRGVEMPYYRNQLIHTY